MLKPLISRKNVRLLAVLAAVALLAILTVGAALAADPAKWRDGEDDAGAEHRTGFRYPLPTQEMPFNRFIATGSQDVGTSAAVLVTTLATDTRGIFVGPVGGVLNFGDSTIPEGTSWPFTIASGSFRFFPVATRTPKIYFRGQVASVTVHRLEQ